ncbi:MAG: tetratricopeptide repeat protein, partial [Candidatus Latescibacteria bacterium]|nr:tetratricopeptide repeat protein [bacterium]MBD3424318.1 tetratricopeptide repeat protein [Candidatus Latescibacterota bacterium]
MSRNIWILICIITFISTAYAKDSIRDQIMEAEKLQQKGELGQAVSILEKALEEHSENATLISYLGLYTGMSAGSTTDFTEAGRLANRSFRLLDKAVSLEPDNPEVRMNRGIIYVNVPEFLGKMNMGIEDLEIAASIISESPEEFSSGRQIAVWTHLGEAYRKSNSHDKAIKAWEEIMEISPGSSQAERARKEIEKLSAQKEKMKKQSSEAPTPESSRMISRGREAYMNGDYSKARELLSQAAEKNPDSYDANRYLGLAYARLAEEGYDERIASDTDLRTNLVMKAVKYLDRAVDIRPDNMELRYTRGSMLIYFPFFTGKSDQGLADLEMVLSSPLPDSVKASAHYLLGVGYHKKGNHHWIEATVKYPESEAAIQAYSDMKPDLWRMDEDEQQDGTVKVDFVLGYRDELPPQIAVWIEDSRGNYIRTLYVSGFSGHVRDRQVVLPVWAESSEFNGIDAVTGASIDVGYH